MPHPLGLCAVSHAPINSPFRASSSHLPIAAVSSKNRSRSPSHRCPPLHGLSPYRFHTPLPRLTSGAHRRVHKQMSLAPLRSAPHTCPPSPHSPSPLRTGPQRRPQAPPRRGPAASCCLRSMLHREGGASAGGVSRYWHWDDQESDGAHHAHWHWRRWQYEGHDRCPHMRWGP